LLVMFINLLSCLDDVKKVEFSFENKKTRTQRVKLIQENVFNFIENNKDKDIIQTYFYIIENSNKTILSNDFNFFKNHIRDSIRVGSNEKLIQISPLPISYKLGSSNIPIYKIKDNLGNTLNSYILSFSIGERYEIKDCWLNISYFDKKGKEFGKKINVDHTFNIENFGR